MHLNTAVKTEFDPLVSNELTDLLGEIKGSMIHFQVLTY